MDLQTLSEFKNQFFELHKHTLEHLENGTQELLEKEMVGDDADRALLEQEQNLVVRFKGRGDLFLKKIENSIKKIENGTFGECEECGDYIGLERLRKRPTASLCIRCKEEEELFQEQSNVRFLFS